MNSKESRPVSSEPYVIYGLRLSEDSDYRYVGLTTRPLRERLRGHLSEAFSARSKYAVHCWIRKHGRSSVTADILEKVDDENFEYLLYAERYWIKSLREFGADLLNHTDGGEGVRGLNLGKTLNPEHRESISLGVIKHFEKNGHKSVYDFWVQDHGVEEADRRWEAKRLKTSQSSSGERNPMYGRRGENAPCYGRVGDKHPLFGTHRSEEEKAKISAATKGKPKSEITKIRMSHANHKRQHAYSVKPTCRWCTGDMLEDVIKEKETELNDNMGRAVPSDT